MARPSLLIVSFSPIVSDARVLKQLALFRDDFDITTVGHGPAPAGVVEHLQIPDELAIWRYPRAAVMLRRYRRAYWGNPAVSSAVRALQGRTFDVALADDVDAVPIALGTNPRFGVHADLHEYSPRQHEESWKFRLFVKPFLEWICRVYVSRASSWTTVSNGLAREYQRRFGFDPQIVTNAAPYVEAEPTPTHDPIRIVHSGAALRDRHLDIIVDGVLASSTATLDLFLTPNDAAYLDELRASADGSGGRIRLHDPVPYAQLAETLRGYDIGVHILPPANFNNRWALPNKLFDYVQARLGVIVGPSPEMAQYVRDYGLGAVTADFTAAALTAVLDGLAVDDVTAFKRAAHAHARELSSESQVTIWKAAIERLMEPGA